MNLRKAKENFVSGGHLHLALRKLRAEFSHPVTLAALAGVAVVVGISGPFGTLDRFALLPRMAYWGAAVPLTYAAGFMGTLAVQPFLPQGPRPLRIAMAAFGSAVMVTVILGLLNMALAIPIGGAGEVMLGFGAVYIICLVIEAVGQVLRAHQPKAQGDAATPALLSRLPVEKRGAILALSAQDHYTTVITTAGREMILIRLADAMAEARPTKGVQIHRSHWVALAAVASVQRGGDGGEVHLTNGARLPIARTRLADLRAAGLLPRKAGI